MIAIHDDLAAIVAVETVGSAKPQEPAMILENRVDRVVRQPVDFDSLELEGRTGNGEQKRPHGEPGLERFHTTKIAGDGGNLEIRGDAGDAEIQLVIIAVTTGVPPRLSQSLSRSPSLYLPLYLPLTPPLYLPPTPPLLASA